MKTLRFLFVAVMAMIGMNVNAADVTDELTWDNLLESGKNTTYQDFSGKKITSNAVYAGNASSGADKYIQLRTSNNNAGIVTTNSGGKLKSVTIAFNSKTTDRSIDIYGKGSAYASASDLYGDNAGTKLGTIAANGESMTLTVEGEYTFVGLRSSNGAIYVDKITIVWDGEGSTEDTRTATSIEFSEGYQTQIAKGPDGMFPEIGSAVALPTATVKAGDATVEGATVEWSVEVKSWKAGNEGQIESPVIQEGKVVNVGDSYGVVNVKATFAGNDSYLNSAKSYTLTFYNTYGKMSEIVNDVVDSDFSKNDETDGDGKPVFFFFRNIDAEGFPVLSYTVSYVNGKYIYLTDGEGVNLLFYGTNSQNLKQGDVISGNVSDTNLGGFWGNLKRYNKLPEFAFTDMNVKIESEGATVEPATITVDQLKDNINAYVKIENAEYVSADGKNLIFKVGETNLAVYNQFNVKVDSLKATAKYTLTGMGCVYKKGDADAVFQLYIADFTKTADATGINAVAADQKKDSIYNLNGQRVMNTRKGLYIINGKKVVMK